MMNIETLQDTLEVFFHIALPVSGVIFFIVSIWGVLGFMPTLRQVLDKTRRTAAVWLALAIICGFAINAFIVGILVIFDTFNLPIVDNPLAAAVRLWWRVSASTVVYMHFYARYRALPIDERAHWSPMLMPFYPNKHTLMYRLLCPVLRIGRKECTPESRE
jgi:uncharacterized protein with PQ loop repeat